MSEQSTIEATPADQQQTDKYLTFALANEEYGLEILAVREIIGVMDVTAVPRTPDFVKGVINLRGKVIPVIDLRLKFAMPEAPHTDETCIIVVNLGNIETGIIVDRVSEVLDIAGDAIEPAPGLGAGVDTSFILGMGKTNGRVLILLDIEKVLGGAADVAAVIESVVAGESGLSE